MNIGYLVPEFPGQTHGFFWREIEQLERLGAKVDVVSTRRPLRGKSSHQWSEVAIQRTTYLHPMSTRQLWSACARLFWSGPAAWWRCATPILRSSPRLLLRMLSLLVVSSNLAQYAREREWTHLHVHSCADAAHLAMFTHLLTGLPYSLTLHGDLHGYGSNQNLKWNHAAFAICVCQAARQQATHSLGTDLPPWVGVAPMGVDLDAFSRRSPYVPYSGSGPLRVFSCGRLHPGKGHEDVIRAVALARGKGLNIALTIGGEDADGGYYKKHLEGVIRQTELESHIQLAGSLTSEAVRDELEAAHVFVLASHQEALGVATMEAMAMELPVIVTRTGGVPELVEDGREGIMVEPHKPDQLATALMICANMPATCTHMGLAGRAKVQKNYHSGLSARAIMDGIAFHASTITTRSEARDAGAIQRLFADTHK